MLKEQHGRPEPQALQDVEKMLPPMDRSVKPVRRDKSAFFVEYQDFLMLIWPFPEARRYGNC